MKRNIQYTELKRIAKQYNNIFENHLNKRSLKSKKFWSSVSLAACVPSLYCTGIYLFIKGNLALSFTALFLLYISEVIALALKVAHDEEQTAEKIRRARLPPPSKQGIILDDSECRRAWLAREIALPPTSYPLLAAEFERIEGQISRQERLLSGLDTRLLRYVAKVPRTLILFLLPILGGLLTFAGQSLLTNPEAFNLSDLSNIKNIGFITLSASILAGGIFILSFLLSLLISLGSFILDTVSLHGCSARSRTRFKRDLYIYSELFPEIESSGVKSPSTARFLHSEAQ
ncbi:hypothetical protein NK553_28590 [Pseudomonas sp. ZM23]|uniref:MotA/TolQ/ExbB proton channel domain-containing protein n=1 Tax=Pseudomonas triclosanedens TaxID=2961893 RepID=A0ABY7A5A3_9PSED|nr:hypothetical protein [Pseudomonas triclosanedens]MCP8467912.1 hypothetical protein [Pseudomonas triclosanedens]MCP8473888.1 hypothetical protein [Pseudomonas triclosanedens]MCP8479894.1 hypothetical protein [Pseudomonas triclosanedens]WAI51303.1 hypothetical protein OU419_08635 [Pseudomonas triclosanedens]